MLSSFSRVLSNRDPTRPARSRLVLVWQSASEADLYGADDITALQVRAFDECEILVISGSGFVSLIISGLSLSASIYRVEESEKATILTPSKLIVQMCKFPAVLFPKKRLKR